MEGDIADAARLRRVAADMDAVMHFAAHAYVGESVEDPQKYFRNNVVGGLSLLNCVLEAGIRRFVFSSSCAVYGRSQRQPIPEATAREPLNPYVDRRWRDWRRFSFRRWRVRWQPSS